MPGSASTWVGPQRKRFAKDLTLFYHGVRGLGGGLSDRRPAQCSAALLLLDEADLHGLLVRGVLELDQGKVREVGHRLV